MSVPAAAPSNRPGLAVFTKNVSPRCANTGNSPAAAAADFTNATPVITEIYLAELFLPAPCTVTGIALFNGSDSTNSVKAAIYDVNGVLIASTAATQLSGTDAYQRIPLALGSDGVTTVSSIQLPAGSYYIATIHSGTTTRYNALAVGNCGAGKLTGHVYGTAFVSTALTITPPVTFTADLGPVASLY